MRHYVNCENAKDAVAKVVTGKTVRFYGSYEDAEKAYESTMKSNEKAELYFRGVRNMWVEMVAED